MRLIDADAVYNTIINDDRITCGTTFQHTILAIKNAPTIEAEPVKHGRWIDDHDFAICSLCDRIIYDAYYEFRDKNDASFHNYCPYCGAKMDGDGGAK